MGKSCIVTAAHTVQKQFRSAMSELKINIHIYLNKYVKGIALLQCIALFNNVKSKDILNECLKIIIKRFIMCGGTDCRHYVLDMIVLRP